MYKIYKIVDNTNNNVYIGQTKKKYLSSRISGHIQDIKRGNYCSSQKILKNNDWGYKLIEETDDKLREKYWINNTPNCINKRTLIYGKGKYNPELKRETQKKYKEKNKDKIKETQKKYKEKNKDKIKETRKYQNSWGGDPRYNNNLLKIDINLFN